MLATTGGSLFWSGNVSTLTCPEQSRTGWEHLHIGSSTRRQIWFRLHFAPRTIRNGDDFTPTLADALRERIRLKSTPMDPSEETVQGKLISNWVSVFVCLCLSDFELWVNGRVSKWVSEFKGNKHSHTHTQRERERVWVRKCMRVCECLCLLVSLSLRNLDNIHNLIIEEIEI